MLIVEIVLEGDTLEDMKVVAGAMGLSLEMAVVMACQHYVRWINEHGFPRIVGLHLRAEGEGEAGADPVVGGPGGDEEDGETNGV